MQILRTYYYTVAEYMRDKCAASNGDYEREPSFSMVCFRSWLVRSLESAYFPLNIIRARSNLVGAINYPG